MDILKDHTRTEEYVEADITWRVCDRQRRIDNCIKAGYVCGTDGNPIQQ